MCYIETIFFIYCEISYNIYIYILPLVYIGKSKSVLLQSYLSATYDTIHTRRKSIYRFSISRYAIR